MNILRLSLIKTSSKFHGCNLMNQGKLQLKPNLIRNTTSPK